MSEIRFLPSLTTVSTSRSTWETKLQEIRELRLSAFAFFPTGLNPQARLEVYKTLRQMKQEFDFQIPFVHLVAGTMDEPEVQMLMDEFGAERFNIHTSILHPINFNYSKPLKRRIDIETNKGGFLESELEEYGGICLDLSHIENYRRTHLQYYQSFMDAITSGKYLLGSNHISTITSKRREWEEDDDLDIYASHWYQEPQDLEYLKQYPKSWFTAYACLELENPITLQLELIKYIQASILPNLPAHYSPVPL